MELKYRYGFGQQYADLEPLIEPYGIEIVGNQPIKDWRKCPLIEPYGIEIRGVLLPCCVADSFNRTLWN